MSVCKVLRDGDAIHEVHGAGMNFKEREQSSTSISDLDLAFPTPVFRAVSKYLDLGFNVKPSQPC